MIEGQHVVVIPALIFLYTLDSFQADIVHDITMRLKTATDSSSHTLPNLLGHSIDPIFVLVTQFHLCNLRSYRSNALSSIVRTSCRNEVCGVY